MEHWEFILFTFALGAFMRRWLGMGGTGSRVVKVPAMTLTLLVLLYPVLEAYDWLHYVVAVAFFVVYWLPGHAFSGEDNLDELAFRYMLPLFVLGIITGIMGIFGFWMAFIAGIGSWACWVLMNIIYHNFPKLSKKIIMGRVFDGPFAYAEALSGGVVFSFAAQWAHML